MKRFSTLLMALVAVLFVSCGSSSSPSKVAVKIYKEMAAGKYESIPENYYFASDNEEDRQDKEQFLISLCKEKIAPQIERQGGIKNIEVLDETISEDGDMAWVKLLITYGNGETEDDSIRLVLDDNGDWKAVMDK